MEATLLKMFYCLGLKSDAFSYSFFASPLPALLPPLPFFSIPLSSGLSYPLLLHFFKLQIPHCFTLVTSFHHWDILSVCFMCYTMGFQYMYTMGSKQVRVIIAIPTHWTLIIFMCWELNTFITILRYNKPLFRSKDTSHLHPCLFNNHLTNWTQVLIFLMIYWAYILKKCRYFLISLNEHVIFLLSSFCEVMLSSV